MRRSLSELSSSSELKVVQVQHELDKAGRASQAEINRLLVRQC